MSDGVALWLRVAAITAVSVALLIALAPDRPPTLVPWPVAVALGTCAGLALFSAIARVRPRLPPATSSASVALGRLAFLGLWATNEEVVWRRVALGELLRAGVVPALAATNFVGPAATESLSAVTSKLTSLTVTVSFGVLPVFALFSEGPPAASFAEPTGAPLILSSMMVVLPPGT